MQCGNIDKALHTLLSDTAFSLKIGLFVIDHIRLAQTILHPVGAVTDRSLVHGYLAEIIATVQPHPQIIVTDMDHQHRVIRRIDERNLPYQTKFPVLIAILVVPRHPLPEDARLGDCLLIPLFPLNLLICGMELLGAYKGGIIRIHVNLSDLRIGA